MKTLAAVLRPFTPDAAAAPLGVAKSPALTPIQKRALQSELRKYRAENDRFAWVAVAMLILLFLVSVGVVVFNLDRPTVASSAAATLGLPAAGCIWWLLRLWREKSATDQLLLLAIHLNEEALASVVATLMRNAKSDLSGWVTPKQNSGSAKADGKE